MMTKDKIVKPQPICPKCNSKNIMYKKTTDNYWCRRCGEVFPKDKELRG